ncbi:asparagine--tRNA ligase [Patescibacteria group bacterium]|nr:asparagine--tRNA ligase [Patescibacteria group bacterium]
MYIYLKNITKHLNKEVVLKGWVFNFRSAGSLYFIQFRDGTGEIQGIISKKDIDNQSWENCNKLTIESSIKIQGKVYADKRSPSGYEMQVNKMEIISVAEEYPIGKKAHGSNFLMNNRHLWVRSNKQRAILKIRDEVIFSIRSFFKEQGFILTDSPVLTPTSCEGTTNLFKTKYFDKNAFLSQTGQLYIESLIYSFGKVYDFGPTFRAEKSKTRRHLTEFWMMDAEAAFVEHQANMKTQEELIAWIIKWVLKNCSKELAIIERDITLLKKIKTPFPVVTYKEMITELQNQGVKIKMGDDFGGDHETIISSMFNSPVFIEKYPAKIKAFYMKPDSINSEFVLNNDLIAPEGYGEIIGGSQRIDDVDTLKKKIKEFKLDPKPLEWYIDLRRYGSVPHSGFGLGLERIITWICKLSHVRESIPFPRLINRLNP